MLRPRSHASALDEALEAAEALFEELAEAHAEANFLESGEYSDPADFASAVVNNLPAIAYALKAGLPVTAWAPLKKNPAEVQRVLRAVRNWSEQARILITRFANGLITLDTFYDLLIAAYEKAAMNSLMAGRRAVGNLSAPVAATVASWQSTIAADTAALRAQQTTDGAAPAAAGGGLGSLIASQFMPQNFIGSGLPGDPVNEFFPSNAMFGGATKGAIASSVESYGNTIKSYQTLGEMSGLEDLPGDSVMCWWELGPADHCIDCIQLADLSPYTEQALLDSGVFPGSGHTRCGSNCACAIGYDVPSEVCGDALSDEGDLMDVGEAASGEARPFPFRESNDGTRLNVWVQEASSCSMPMDVSAFNPEGEFDEIDDEDAFDFDEDLALAIVGDLDTESLALLDEMLLEDSEVAKMFGWLDDIIGEAAVAETKVSKYEMAADGVRYQFAWHETASAVVFDFGMTTKGATTLDPEMTMKAIRDLAERAASKKKGLIINGETAGPGMQKWLDALGAERITSGGTTPGLIPKWDLIPPPLPKPTFTHRLPEVVGLPRPPKPQAWTVIGEANPLGGYNPKSLVAGAHGDTFLVKHGTAAPWEEAASGIHADLGMRVSPAIHTVGKDSVAEGSIQPLIEHSTALDAKHPVDVWAHLTPEQAHEVNRQSVLDMLLANDDAHAGQFLIDDKGRVWGIDKGLAFRDLSLKPADAQFYLKPPTGSETGYPGVLYGEALRHPKQSRILESLTPEDVQGALDEVLAVPVDDLLIKANGALDHVQRFVGDAEYMPRAEAEAVFRKRYADLRGAYEDTYRQVIAGYPDTPKVWADWAAQGGHFGAEPEVAALPLPTIAASVLPAPEATLDAATARLWATMDLSPLPVGVPTSYAGELTGVGQWAESFSLEQTNLIARRMDGLKALGVDTTKLDRLGRMNHEEALSLHANAAAYDKFVGGGATIRIDADWVRNPIDVCTDIGETVAHEYAHVLESSLTPADRKALESLYASLNEAARKKVSAYAAESYDEWFPEVFTTITKPGYVPGTVPYDQQVYAALRSSGLWTPPAVVPAAVGPINGQRVWANIDDLIADLTARYPGADFEDLRKLDFHMATVAMNSMDETFGRFGTDGFVFKGVKAPKTGGNTIAEVKRVNPNEPGSAIFLYRDWWTDPHKFDSHAQGLGHHTYFSVSDRAETGDLAAAGILTHEMGHEYMGLHLYSRFGVKGSDARADVDAWFTEFRKTYKSKPITTYSAKNEHEAWAEAFEAAVGPKAARVDDPRINDLRAILDKHYPEQVALPAVPEQAVAAAIPQPTVPVFAVPGWATLKKVEPPKGLGGTLPKATYVDPTGRTWMWKAGGSNKWAIADPETMAQTEAAASRIGKVLDTSVVPVSAVRNPDNEWGTMQVLVPNANEAHSAVGVMSVGQREELARQSVLDRLLGYPDASHENFLLVPDGPLIGIDKSGGLVGVVADGAAGHIDDATFPPGFWDNLTDPNQWQPLEGLDPAVIGRVLDRADQMTDETYLAIVGNDTIAALAKATYRDASKNQVKVTEQQVRDYLLTRKHHLRADTEGYWRSRVTDLDGAVARDGSVVKVPDEWKAWVGKGGTFAPEPVPGEWGAVAATVPTNLAKTTIPQTPMQSLLPAQMRSEATVPSNVGTNRAAWQVGFKPGKDRAQAEEMLADLTGGGKNHVDMLSVDQLNDVTARLELLDNLGFDTTRIRITDFAKATEAEKHGAVTLTKGHAVLVRDDAKWPFYPPGVVARPTAYEDLGGAVAHEYGGVLLADMSPAGRADLKALWAIHKDVPLSDYSKGGFDDWFGEVIAEVSRPGYKRGTLPYDDDVYRILDEQGMLKKAVLAKDPIGPPLPLKGEVAIKQGDPQMYLVSDSDLPVNSPLAQWTGNVPDEPPLPTAVLKADPAELAAKKALADAAEDGHDWHGVASGKVKVAFSGSQKDAEAAQQAGLIYENVNGVRLVAHDQTAMNEAKAWLAMEGHAANTDEFWLEVLGYSQKDLDALDNYAAAKSGKRLTAGVVMVEPDGRVWVLAPRNEFAGYRNTWVKGGVDPGETAAEAAVREVREESGFSVEIDGYLGDYMNTDKTGIARMYVGHRTGGGPLFAHPKETYKMRLLSRKDAEKALTRYNKPDARDQTILADTFALLDGEATHADFLVKPDEVGAFSAKLKPIEPRAYEAAPGRSMAVLPEYTPPPEVPASATFGYDADAVHGYVGTESTTPPSPTFQLSTTKYKAPNGDVQTMYWKTEPYSGPTPLTVTDGIIDAAPAPGPMVVLETPPVPLEKVRSTPGVLASSKGGVIPEYEGKAIAVQTVTMYHVTTRANAEAILATGFDLSKVKPNWTNDYAVSATKGSLQKAREWFMPLDPKTAKPTGVMSGDRVVLELKVKGRFFDSEMHVGPGTAFGAKKYTADMVASGFDVADNGATQYIYNLDSIVSVRAVGPEAEKAIAAAKATVEVPVEVAAKAAAVVPAAPPVASATTKPGIDAAIKRINAQKGYETEVVPWEELHARVDHSIGATGLPGELRFGPDPGAGKLGTPAGARLYVIYGSDGTPAAISQVVFKPNGTVQYARELRTRADLLGQGWATRLYDAIQDTTDVNLYPAVGKGNTKEGRAFVKAWLTHRKTIEPKPGLDEAIARLPHTELSSPDAVPPWAFMATSVPGLKTGKPGTIAVTDWATGKNIVMFGDDGNIAAAMWLDFPDADGVRKVLEVQTDPTLLGKGWMTRLYDAVQDTTEFNLYPGVGYENTPAGKAFVEKWLEHRKTMGMAKAAAPEAALHAAPVVAKPITHKAGLDEAILRTATEPVKPGLTPTKWDSLLTHVPATGNPGEALEVPGQWWDYAVIYGDDGTPASIAQLGINQWTTTADGGHIMNKRQLTSMEVIRTDPGKAQQGWASRLYDFIQDDTDLNLYDVVGQTNTPDGKAFVTKWLQHRKALEAATTVEPTTLPEVAALRKVGSLTGMKQVPGKDVKTLGGSAQKALWRDKDDGDYLVKYGPESAVESASSTLAADMGLRVAPARILPDGSGTIQAWVPGSHTLPELDTGQAVFATLTAEQAVELTRQSVLDFALANADTYSGQFLVDAEGRLWGIDKAYGYQGLGLLDADKKWWAEVDGLYPTVFGGAISHPAESGILTAVKPGDVADAIRRFETVSADDIVARSTTAIASLPSFSEYEVGTVAETEALLRHQIAAVRPSYDGMFADAVAAMGDAAPNEWKAWVKAGATFTEQASLPSTPPPSVTAPLKRIFWANSKKQVTDPALRTDLHMAQLQTFLEQMGADPSIAALRVNDALLDQVPVLREVLLAAGATAPTKGTLELGKNEAATLLGTLKNDLPLAKPDIHIPTAALNPEALKTGGDGVYEVGKVGALLDSADVPSVGPFSLGGFHEMKWGTEKVTTSWTLDSSSVVALTGSLYGVPSNEARDILAANLATMGHLLKSHPDAAPVTEVWLGQFLVDGTKTDPALESLLLHVGGKNIGGAWMVPADGLKAFADEVTVDLGHAGLGKGAAMTVEHGVALAEPPASALPSSLSTTYHYDVGSVGSVKLSSAAYEEEGGKPMFNAFWEYSGSQVETHYSTQNGELHWVAQRLKKWSAGSTEAGYGVRSVKYLGDVMDLNPELVTFTADKVALAKSGGAVRKMLLDAGGTEDADGLLSIGREDLLGLRDRIAKELPEPPVAPLNGTLPDTLGYSIDDVVANFPGNPVLNPVDSHSLHGAGWEMVYHLDCHHVLSGSPHTLEVTNVIGLKGMAHEQQAARWIAGLVNLPTTGVDRYLIDARLLPSDLKGALLASGAERKAEVFILEPKAMQDFVKRALGESSSAATEAAEAAKVASVAAEAIPTAKSAQKAALALVSGVDEKTLYGGVAMTGTSYGAEGTAVWRRLGNVLEVHSALLTDPGFTAHVSRMAKAMEEAPKVSALRFANTSTYAMTAKQGDLLAAFGKQYAGGVRLTREQVFALRDTLLQQADNLGAVPGKVSKQGLEDALSRVGDIKPSVASGGDIHGLWSAEVPTDPEWALGVPGTIKTRPMGPYFTQYLLYDADGKVVATMKTAVEEGHPDKVFIVATRPDALGKGYATSLYDLVQDTTDVNLYDLVGQGAMSTEGKGFVTKWLEHRAALEGVTPKAAEVVAQAPTPAFLSAYDVPASEVAALSVETIVQKQGFRKWVFSTPGVEQDVTVRVRYLSQELVWDNVGGTPVMAYREAGSIRALAELGSSLKDDASLATVKRIRFQNIDQLPTSTRKMLTDAGAYSEGSAEVLYLDRDYAITLAESIRKDTNAGAATLKASVVAPEPSTVTPGLCTAVSTNAETVVAEDAASNILPGTYGATVLFADGTKMSVLTMGGEHIIDGVGLEGLDYGTAMLATIHKLAQETFEGGIGHFGVSDNILLGAKGTAIKQMLIDAGAKVDGDVIRVADPTLAHNIVYAIEHDTVVEHLANVSAPPPSIDNVGATFAAQHGVDPAVMGDYGWDGPLYPTTGMFTSGEVHATGPDGIPTVVEFYKAPPGANVDYTVAPHWAKEDKPFSLAIVAQTDATWMPGAKKVGIRDLHPEVNDALVAAGGHLTEWDGVIISQDDLHAFVVHNLEGNAAHRKPIVGSAAVQMPPGDPVLMDLLMLGGDDAEVKALYSTTSTVTGGLTDGDALTGINRVLHIGPGDGITAEFSIFPDKTVVVNSLSSPVQKSAGEWAGASLHVYKRLDTLLNAPGSVAGTAKDIRLVKLVVDTQPGMREVAKAFGAIDLPQGGLLITKEQLHSIAQAAESQFGDLVTVPVKAEDVLAAAVGNPWKPWVSVDIGKWGQSPLTADYGTLGIDGFHHVEYLASDPAMGAQVPWLTMKWKPQVPDSAGNFMAPTVWLHDGVAQGAAPVGETLHQAKAAMLSDVLHMAAEGPEQVFVSDTFLALDDGLKAVIDSVGGAHVSAGMFQSVNGEGGFVLVPGKVKALAKKFDEGLDTNPVGFTPPRAPSLKTAIDYDPDAAEAIWGAMPDIQSFAGFPTQAGGWAKPLYTSKAAELAGDDPLVNLSYLQQGPDVTVTAITDATTDDALVAALLTVGKYADDEGLHLTFLASTFADEQGGAALKKMLKAAGAVGGDQPGSYRIPKAKVEDFLSGLKDKTLDGITVKATAPLPTPETFIGKYVAGADPAGAMAKVYATVTVTDKPQGFWELTSSGYTYSGKQAKSRFRQSGTTLTWKVTSANEGMLMPGDEFARIVAMGDRLEGAPTVTKVVVENYVVLGGAVRKALDEGGGWAEGSNFVISRENLLALRDALKADMAGMPTAAKVADHVGALASIPIDPQNISAKSTLATTLYNMPGTPTNTAYTVGDTAVAWDLSDSYPGVVGTYDGMLVYHTVPKTGPNSAEDLFAIIGMDVGDAKEANGLRPLVLKKSVLDAVPQVKAVLEPYGKVLPDGALFIDGPTHTMLAISFGDGLPLPTPGVLSSDISKAVDHNATKVADSLAQTGSGQDAAVIAFMHPTDFSLGIGVKVNVEWDKASITTLIRDGSKDSAEVLDQTKAVVIAYAQACGAKGKQLWVDGSAWLDNPELHVWLQELAAADPKNVIDLGMTIEVDAAAFAPKVVARPPSELGKALKDLWNVNSSNYVLPGALKDVASGNQFYLDAMFWLPGSKHITAHLQNVNGKLLVIDVTTAPGVTGQDVGLVYAALKQVAPDTLVLSPEALGHMGAVDMNLIPLFTLHGAPDQLAQGIHPLASAHDFWAAMPKADTTAFGKMKAANEAAYDSVLAEHALLSSTSILGPTGMSEGLVSTTASSYNVIVLKVTGLNPNILAADGVAPEDFFAGLQQMASAQQKSVIFMGDGYTWAKANLPMGWVTESPGSGNLYMDAAAVKGYAGKAVVAATPAPAAAAPAAFVISDTAKTAKEVVAKAIGQAQADGKAYQLFGVTLDVPIAGATDLPAIMAVPSNPSDAFDYLTGALLYVDSSGKDLFWKKGIDANIDSVLTAAGAQGGTEYWDLSSVASKILGGATVPAPSATATKTLEQVGSDFWNKAGAEDLSDSLTQLASSKFGSSHKVVVLNGHEMDIDIGISGDKNLLILQGVGTMPGVTADDIAEVIVGLNWAAQQYGFKFAYNAGDLGGNVSALAHHLQTFGLDLKGTTHPTFSAIKVLDEKDVAAVAGAYFPLPVGAFQPVPVHVGAVAGDAKFLQDEVVTAWQAATPGHFATPSGISGSKMATGGIYITAYPLPPAGQASDYFDALHGIANSTHEEVTVSAGISNKVDGLFSGAGTPKDFNGDWVIKPGDGAGGAAPARGPLSQTMGWDLSGGTGFSPNPTDYYYKGKVRQLTYADQTVTGYSHPPGEAAKQIRFLYGDLKARVLLKSKYYGSYGSPEQWEAATWDAVQRLAEKAAQSNRPFMVMDSFDATGKTAALLQKFGAKAKSLADGTGLELKPAQAQKLADAMKGGATLDGGLASFIASNSIAPGNPFSIAVGAAATDQPATKVYMLGGKVMANLDWVKAETDSMDVSLLTDILFHDPSLTPAQAKAIVADAANAAAADGIQLHISKDTWDLMHLSDADLMAHFDPGIASGGYLGTADPAAFAAFLTQSAPSPVAAAAAANATIAAAAPAVFTHADFVAKNFIGVAHGGFTDALNLASGPGEAGTFIYKGKGNLPWATVQHEVDSSTDILRASVEFAPNADMVAKRAVLGDVAMSADGKGLRLGLDDLTLAKADITNDLDGLLVWDVDGQVWVATDQKALSDILLGKKAMPTTGGDLIPPALEAAPEPTLAAAVPGVAAAATPPPPSGLGDAYGFHADKALDLSKSMADPDHPSLVVDIINETPLTKVYDDKWANGVTIRWAEEQQGDARILRVRAVSGTNAQEQANALAAGLMGHWPTYLESHPDVARIVITKKAVGGTPAFEAMLKDSGWKETKEYWVLDRAKVGPLSQSLAENNADWMATTAIPTFTLPGGAKPLGSIDKPSTSFIYDYDAQQAAHYYATMTDEVVTDTTGLKFTGKPVKAGTTIHRVQVGPVEALTGVGSSGESLGFGEMTILGTATTEERMAAAYAVLRKVAEDSQGHSKWFWVGEDVYQQVPGLEELLTAAGGEVHSGWSNLGTVIRMKPDQAKVLAEAIATDTAGALTSGLSESSAYLGYSILKADEMLGKGPVDKGKGVLVWATGGSGAAAKSTMKVAITADKAIAEMVDITAEQTVSAVTFVAQLNWFVEQGASTVIIDNKVLAAVPRLNKWLIAVGGDVESGGIRLSNATLYNARSMLVKDGLPALLGGKAIKPTILDGLITSEAKVAAAAMTQKASSKATSDVATFLLEGHELRVGYTQGTSNILWRTIERGAATKGAERAAVAAQLRTFLNQMGQNAALKNLDFDAKMLADHPNLTALLRKYGAKEVPASNGGPAMLSLERAKAMRLRKDLENELGKMAPSSTGSAAILIDWPIAEDLALTDRVLSGQTTKYVFKDASGAEWVFKPGASGRGAETDKAVAELAAILGLPVPPQRIYTLDIRGETMMGSLQKMVPNLKADGIARVEDLTPEQAQDLWRHEVLDWLVANDDSHRGNFLIDADGHLWGIDKTRAFEALNDGRHDVLSSTNLAQGGTADLQPLFYKFFKSAQGNPDILKGVHPHTMSRTLRAVRDLDDGTYQRIVEGIAPLTRNPKYRGQAEKMVEDMLARKHRVATDLEEYVAKELRAIKASGKPLPKEWDDWLKAGGHFNLDATPEDLWKERMAVLDAVYGTTPDLRPMTGGGKLGKVKNMMTSGYGSGVTGADSGAGRIVSGAGHVDSGHHYRYEDVRPTLNRTPEGAAICKEWEERNEHIILHAIFDTDTSWSSAQSWIPRLRKNWRPDSGRVRIIRTTKGYVGGAQATYDGYSRYGFRNLFSAGLDGHTWMANDKVVYADVRPDQIFTSMFSGFADWESEVSISDMTIDQVIAVRTRANYIPEGAQLIGYNGPVVVR